MTKTKTLDNGLKIPTFGFGTWGLEKDKAQEAIEYAMEVGCWHIDTADIYGTHEIVGNALKSIDSKREDVFITSKLWKNNMTEDLIPDAVDRFLDELDTDYIDLLLIHRRNHSVELEETLGAMQKEVDKGKVKSIGVSNFEANDIKDVLDTGIEIVNNQIEQHPSFSQPELRKLCYDNDITVTAYSPLGRGKDLELNVVQSIAQKYGKPASQVVLNWAMAHDMIVIPRSSDKDHIKENYGASTWSLADEDVEKLDELNTGNRIQD
ncbi:aldo/keto reductase [Candidatus Dojkabacteria bacterium]|nr:aldo/keto reductase [Candidatus Dojkabacteria bacterium]